MALCPPLDLFADVLVECWPELFDLLCDKLKQNNK